ncbi:Inner membrane transport protein YajR [Candidatus Hartigia pinicola]|nr:Inner membrane transport protein YajR [Candidatus Hartigia pinicola]
MNDNKMTSSELNATLSLSFIFFLRMLGMFMILPIITSYGLQLQGSTKFLIGVAIGIYGFSQAIFQIPFGLTSDQIGRKPLIVFGLIIFILGSVLAALSESIWGVIIGRALQGSGAISGVIMALLSDLTREQHRTKAMAFLGIGCGVTFSIALVIGPIITQWVGLSGLFWGITFLTGSAIIITIFIVPNSYQQITNRESSFIKNNLNSVLTHPQLLKLNFGILNLHTLLMTIFIALPFIMTEAGAFAKDHWKIYLITMVIALISSFPFIIYAEKKRQIKAVFLFCISLLALSEIILWLSKSHLWIIFLGLQLFFIAFNVLEAILPSLISKESPASCKGTAMGVYSTSQFLGVAIGGFVGGWLYDINSADTVFIAGLFLTIVWFIISLTMKQPSYLTSIRLELPKHYTNIIQLQKALTSQPGVVDFVIIKKEKSIYLKVDRKLIVREQLETIVQSCL